MKRFGVIIWLVAYCWFGSAAARADWASDAAYVRAMPESFVFGGQSFVASYSGDDGPDGVVKAYDGPNGATFFAIAADYEGGSYSQLSFPPGEFTNLSYIGAEVTFNVAGPFTKAAALARFPNNGSGLNDLGLVCRGHLGSVNAGWVGSGAGRGNADDLGGLLFFSLLPASAAVAVFGIAGVSLSIAWFAVVRKRLSTNGVTR